MHAMQYKIHLPNDYDMAKIRERVLSNGSKTDGFQDLFIKAYLILDKPLHKEYSPLYLWKNREGMNRFVFEGFYDNILQSFGWQNINIAIPVHIDIPPTITNTRYILEIKQSIKRNESMPPLTFTYLISKTMGKLLVYNPDKWKAVEFYFFEDYPHDATNYGTVYEVLHVSI